MRVLKEFGGRLYALWAIVAAIVAGFIVGTVMALPFVVVSRGRRERYTVYATQTFGWIVVHVIALARLELRRPTEPPTDRGALVICNHRSWLDPPLLSAYLRANGLSKRAILYLPFIGFYGWLAGIVFFDRKSPMARKRARDEALAMMRAGNRVFVFPEGTRSRTGVLLERVQLGLVKSCHEAGIPVLPCAVHGTELALPVGRLVAFPFQRIGLDIGQLVEPADHPDADSFATAAWEQVRRMATADATAAN